MKKTYAQKIRIGLYSFAILVALVVVAGVIKVRMDISHLLNNGVRVKGLVTNKAERTASNRRSTKSNYQFDLNLFIDTSAPKASQPKPQNFNEQMDALMAASKMRMQNQFKEGYAKVSVKVSSDSFQKYSLGQVVDVVHLKDQPDTARLIEDVQ
jgi:hypothetical protein